MQLTGTVPLDLGEHVLQGFRRARFRLGELDDPTGGDQDRPLLLERSNDAADLTCRESFPVLDVFDGEGRAFLLGDP